MMGWSCSPRLNTTRVITGHNTCNHVFLAETSAASGSQAAHQGVLAGGGDADAVGQMA